MPIETQGSDEVARRNPLTIKLSDPEMADLQLTAAFHETPPSVIARDWSRSRIRKEAARIRSDAGPMQTQHPAA